jgi:hypothetical protein
MNTPPIDPQITVGYVSGADPYIVAIETLWPDPTKAPIYNARLSRHKGFTELKALVNDKRIRIRDEPPKLVAATDEVEADEVTSQGWNTYWVRPIRGPGTEKEACVLVNVAEVETSMRRLAEDKRLRFPKSMGALGRRAGGDVDVADHELLALGLACWYAFQTYDRTRSQPMDVRKPSEREAHRPAFLDQWQTDPWGTAGSEDPFG